MYLKLKEMLSEYNLKVVYMEMKEPGFYYPKPRIIFEWKSIWRNCRSLSFISWTCAFHRFSFWIFSLYDTSTTFHSKFETEADKIAILILLNIYIENELTDESQFNLENLWSIILFRISSDTLVMLSANAILRKYSYARQYVWIHQELLKPISAKH